MNLKHLLITAVCAAAALSASAQGQGYLDGVDYFKVEQYDNAREILERTLNDGSTDKATAYYYLGQIALFNNDQATAQDYFNKGISADSKNGLNYVGMGALALKQGNAAEAKTSLRLRSRLTSRPRRMWPLPVHTSMLILCSMPRSMRIT